MTRPIDPKNDSIRVGIVTLLQQGIQMPGVYDGTTVFEVLHDLEDELGKMIGTSPDRHTNDQIYQLRKEVDQALHGGLKAFASVTQNDELKTIIGGSFTDSSQIAFDDLPRVLKGATKLLSTVPVLAAPGAVDNVVQHRTDLMNAITQIEALHDQTIVQAYRNKAPRGPDEKKR